MFFVGVVLLILVAAFYFYSFPRGGKLASFVGTSWETPLTLAATCGVAIGFVLVMAGWR